MRKVALLLICLCAFIHAEQPVKSVDAMIKTTLYILAHMYECHTMGDYNNDDRIDDIDFAILFYYHYPDKKSCGIWTNAKLNYTFNVIKINGDWVGVDPRACMIALFRDIDMFYMSEIYGAEYDSQYDYDAWYKYGRYCE